MTIFGVSLILMLGILNLALILFQVSTGKKWLKVPFSAHRRTGFILLLSALAHAVLAFLAGR
jgi:hypothetical protein